jgi:hypothetical protein
MSSMVRLRLLELFKGLARVFLHVYVMVEGLSSYLMGGGKVYKVV